VPASSIHPGYIDLTDGLAFEVTVVVVRGVSRRSRWLGHPLFLAAVAILVLNDHFLKSTFPGWWTGKLSDAAGVAVVGVIASVVLDASCGLALTALVFSALKVVPGVAEVLSSVLGGVTARDRSDLLTLVVLVPTWRLLRGSARNSRFSLARFRLRQSAAVSSVLPLLGGVLAVFACTATSCGPRPAVVRVMSSGNTVFVEIEHNYPVTTWARSDDGGRTWLASERPPDAPPDSDSAVYFGDPAPRGPLDACAADGTCYWLRDQHAIERLNPDSSSTPEFVLTDHQFDGISTGCTGPHRGVLGSISSAGASSGSGVVASLGANGVVVRQADGRWEQTRVLGVRPPRRNIGTPVTAVEVFVGPAIAVGLLLVGRRRWPSWRAAVVIGFVGWAATIAASGFTAMVSTAGIEGPSWFVAPLGQAVTLITAIVVGRSQWFAPHPRAPLPPPTGNYPGAPPPTG
jgi:hypothetical protein